MYIRKLDYFSPLITLYYKGETRHSSLFSGIISILFSIFVFLVCLFISLDFLLKKNPSSSYFKREIKDVGKINLTHNFFFHYISFLDENLNNTYDEKVFSIIGLNERFDDFLKNTSLSEYDFSHWKYEKCEKLNLNKENIYNYMKEEIDFNFSLCLSKYYNKKTNTIINYDNEDFPFPILQNNVNNEHIINYGIIIKQCENNSLYNNNSCYDNQRIEEIAFEKDRKYIFKYFSNFFDIENYKNPLIKQLSKINLYYNPFFVKKNEVNLLQTFIETSDGFFFHNNKELKTINLDNCYESYSYNFNYRILEMIEIKMTNKIEVHQRKYKKIQDIIGAVDGMIEILVFLIEILNDIFYHNFRLVNDFNDVIGEKVEKIKKEQKSDFNIISPRNNNSKIFNNFFNKNKLSKFSPKINNHENNGIVKVSSLQLKDLSYCCKLNSNVDLSGNYKINIVSTFQKFSWLIYIKSNFFCYQKKIYNYYDKILLLRKNILSEERLLKNYWKIKKINKGIFDVKILSDNPSLRTFTDRKDI